MSDKKPDWQIPDHDPEKNSGAKKAADIWSGGGKQKKPTSDDPLYKFDEFNEDRGRKAPQQSDDKAPPNGKRRLLLFFGALFLLYLGLIAFYPSVSLFDNPYGVRNLLFIIIFGGSLVYFSRASNSAIFKALFGWIAIVSIISGIYVVNRGDSYSLANNLTPSRVVAKNEEMQVERASDGHFWILTQVNGHNLPMMVDTGATMVVLSKRDAKRIGIEMDKLRFNGASSTANGKVSFARVSLDEFRIGHVAFNDFMVTVNGGQMDGSLLGLDALNEFSSYEIRGNIMILRP